MLTFLKLSRRCRVVLAEKTDRLCVTGVNDAVSALVTALADRPALVGALSTLVGGAVSVAAGPRVGGRQATWLVSDGISVLVDEQDPERPVSLTTMPGRTLPGGFTNLVLEFNSYGNPVNRDVPTEVATAYLAWKSRSEASAARDTVTEI